MAKLSTEERLQLLKQMEKDGLCTIEWHKDEVGEAKITWHKEVEPETLELEPTPMEKEKGKYIRVKIGLTALKELWRKVDVIETRAERVRMELGKLIDDAEAESGKGE